MTYFIRTNTAGKRDYRVVYVCVIILCDHVINYKYYLIGYSLCTVFLLPIKSKHKTSATSPRMKLTLLLLSYR